MSIFNNHEELKEALGIATVAGLFGMFIGLARGIIQEKHGGWANFCRGAIASITVAVIAGLGLEGSDLSISKQAAVIGVCAYVADDVLLGLIAVARLFSTDPLGFLREIVSSIRGGRK